jgi:tetraacyldisaccharide 4'-kinase
MRHLFWKLAMFKAMALTWTRYWYRPTRHGLMMLLLPASWLFAAIVALRRYLYRRGIMRITHFPVPVIVVGNIVLGGTGKTPLVIWLSDFLRSCGYQPGIVSRGYGGKKQAQPYWVHSHDRAADVGDEAVLLARRTQCPLVICQDRVAAVRDLLKQSSCNIVISDDGLQHYSLGRDIEIAVMDGERRGGNGHLLPAGPLREPLLRLQEVDFVVVNGGHAHDDFTLSLQPGLLHSLSDNASVELRAFPHKRVHAVAGIGHPERFFATLKQAGLDVIPHPFPDHYPYQPHDMDFADTLPIIMTEKDAVKCRAFANERYWYLPVTAKISPGFQDKIWDKLKRLERCHDSEADFTKHACHLTHRPQHHEPSERS